MVQLGGRPLISYPIAAAQAAGLDVVVVAKSSTRLPDLDVPVLLEPDAPVHPLLGVLTALQKLPAVLALPCDMPFVEPADLAALAEMDDDGGDPWLPGQPFPLALPPRSHRCLSCDSLEAESVGAVDAGALSFCARGGLVDRAGQQLVVNTPKRT